MRALTVAPKQADSLQVSDVADPNPEDNELLVDGLAIGVCGTDKEIARGEYGWAPPHRDRLILGHESLGRVAHAPRDSGFEPGDLVVGVVRCPDPGLEHVGMLMEPTTVVCKAWEQVQRVGERAWFEPERVLVTGAGPIGLLAALLAVQKGLDTHVLDRVADGPKPGIVKSLGATYHHDDICDVAGKLRPDVVIEATGAGPVVFGTIENTGAYGIVCLTGVSRSGRTLRIDAGDVNREIVLENDAIVGSVNANLRHYHQAADALAKADVDWLAGLITRRVPLDRATEAFTAGPSDVKVVIELDAGT
jgi:glucose 1-dehydrogenase